MPGDRTPDWLARYEACGEVERRDLDRVRRLWDETPDPYDRALPLHLTGSAVVVDPATGTVLLRWHERQNAWLHVGGHGDPGEVDLYRIALREASEETGLEDLKPCSAVAETGGDAPLLPIHLVVVPVAPKGDEPAHEHADVRYVLATATPELARPESDSAVLRWVPIGQAVAEVDPNLGEALRRVRRRCSGSSP